jgi:6-phosphogluconolactonase
MSEESLRCGFVTGALPLYSTGVRRSPCLCFATPRNSFGRKPFIKAPVLEKLSRPTLVPVVMSTTATKTRYVDSDFSVFRISPNEEDLVASFGEYFVEIASNAVKKQGSFTLAISGGSVLQYFSKAILETPDRKERVDWENTLIFLVDERYVPWDDPQSNFGQLRKALQRSGIDQKVKVFPVNTSLPLEEAASSYEHDILSCENQTDFIRVLHQPVKYQVERVPAFDLILLGLGEDGHTASLFPNKELLGETKKLVAYERNSPKPPSERITLTFPALNYAKNVAFIVVGKGKADIMQRLCEDHSVQYPARLVTPFLTRKDW